ncbi:MAG: hypothetical protein PVJ89_12525, partial [Planctomycetota bacterium]
MNEHARRAARTLPTSLLLVGLLVPGTAAAPLSPAPLRAAPLPAALQLPSAAPTAEDERARVELYDSLRAVDRETPEARVAQAVKPSVVYVETEMVQNVRTIF